MRLPRRLQLLLLLLCLLAVACNGCASSSGEQAGAPEESRTTLVLESKKEPKVPLPKGDPPKKLVVEDLREGEGMRARRGDLLVTKLTADFVTGKHLESSWEKGGGEFIFHLGADEANPGWEKGIPGMRVGGLRKLIVPPDEGSRFGPVGEGKPKDTLVYVVELVAILPPEVEKRQEPKVVPPSGAPPHDLKVEDIIRGTGPAVQQGDILTVEYVGIRYDGSPFTNSWERRKKFQFQLGAGSLKVNPGWEMGLRGMRVGGRRELIIPPKLLSPGGAPPGSKPSDTLIYVIDLLGLTEPDAQPGGAASVS